MTHPIDNSQTTRLSRRWLGLARVIWIILLAGVTLRPIAADDFWWHLARGRSGWQGTASPSAGLLSLDKASEADWFGGVPLFVIHDVAGFTGLMLLRVAVVVGVALLLTRLAGGLRSAGAAATLAIGMTACLPAFDVTPRMFDVIGLLLVATLASRATSDADRWRNLVAPLAVLAMWANLATMPIVGWALFAAARGDAAITGSSGGSPAARPRQPFAAAVKWLSLELFLAAGTCSLTPRGVFTLWDSLRLAVPRLVVDAAVLQETAWRPLIASEWGLAASAFVLLTISAFWQLLKRPPSLVVCVQVFAAATFGWLNAAAVPIAALWLKVAITQTWRAGGVSPPVRLGDQDHRGADAPRSPETIDEVRPPGRWRRLIPTTVFAGLTVIVWLSWPGERPGWGLDPRLDHRLLDATLREVTLDGTAWADDVRSAGMCSWVTRGRIKPHDVPQRALLGGRLRDFVLLRHDLEWNRLSRYRREDDSWGGWWLPLRERRTGLVLVAAEHTRLIRSLEPTIWKPLVLDSPVLPYGQAGDPGVSTRIVQILKLRGFVEDGAWVSHLLGPSGTDLSFDLWGFTGGVSPNLEQELRQSRVFRALHLPRAGLRVLLPALRVSQLQPLLHEFALCNRDLAEHELRTHGWYSQWRFLLSVALSSPAIQKQRKGYPVFIRFADQVLSLADYFRFARPVPDCPMSPWRIQEPDQEHKSGSAVRPDALYLSAALFQSVDYWKEYRDRFENTLYLPSYEPALTLAYRGENKSALEELAQSSVNLDSENRDNDFMRLQFAHARACLEWDAGNLDRARNEIETVRRPGSRKDNEIDRWVREVLESLRNAPAH